MTALLPAAPGSTEYAEGTASFNLLRVPDPAAAVVARDVAAVQDAVTAARQAGLRAVAFSTGHASGMLGALDDALLVRLALDEPVVVDPAARTARVPAGATWDAVVAAAAAHGLLAPHGSAGTVGAVGYLLNGGIGFTGRTVGVGANSVTAVEYVAADGTLLRADADHDPDRFWALRGGGPGVGLVTAVELRLRPGRTVLSGARIYPAERADDRFRAWRDWCADAPRSVTTTARVLRLPPLPHLPPFLTAGPVVAVDGVSLIEEDEAARTSTDDLLGALDAFGPPLLDTWHEGPSADALDAHMDPRDPVPAWTGFDLLNALPDEAIEVFTELAVGPSPLLMHELRQLGGALADPGAPGGCFDRVAEPFLFNGVAIAAEPSVLSAVHAHAARLRESLAPWLSPGVVRTFLKSPGDPRLSVEDEVTARLVAVRAEADPHGLFAVRP